MFLFDLRIAWRGLRRSPGFTAAVVATLALGLGANAALFAMLSELLWKPLPFSDPDRLVSVFGLRADKSETGVAWLDVRDWQQATHSLSALGVYRDRTFLLAGPPNTVITAGMVSAGFFAALDVRPAFGRAMQPSDEHAGNNHVVWFSDALWRNRFHADRSAIGKIVRLNEETFTIAGVLPPLAFPMRGSIPDLYFPLEERDYAQRRGGGGIGAIGRLRAGVSIRAARADLEAASAALSNRRYGASLRPLREQLAGNQAAPLWLLFGAAGLLFAISAVNVANLLIARSLARKRETSIRISLGASSARLLQQRLIEAGLLAALSSIAAFAVAAARLDWRTSVFAAMAAVVTTLGLGLIPAPSLTQRQSSLRRVLVISQIALSFSLLLAAGLLLHGLWNTLHVNPGFSPRQVLTVGIGIPEARYDSDGKMVRFYERAIAKLAGVPGVELAAGGAGLPMTGTGTAKYQREDRPVDRDQRPTAAWSIASPAYFAALKIPVLQGREFSPEDRIGLPPVCVINRALAQAAFRGESAIGKRLMPDLDTASYARGTAWEIVGIVADAHQVSLEQDPLPQFFVPLYQFPSEGLRFILRTAASPAELTPAVRAAIADVDPNLEQVTPAPMSRFIDRSLESRRRTALLLASFAAAALLVTALGLFGLMAFQVARRSKELGIRMAVGATPQSILRLVLREGIVLLLIGLPCGAALSLALLRIFRHAVPLPASDLVAQVGAVLTLCCAGMLACWWPARRAARLDPLTTLRTE